MKQAKTRSEKIKRENIYIKIEELIYIVIMLRILVEMNKF